MLCPSCQAENDDAAQVCFTCRTILSAVTRGTVIGGRYEILSPLGKGGMGAVYKTRDRVLDEVVALKLLRADVAGTPEMAERFRSEIRLARRVSHWNVCRIHEYGEDGKLQYISMELVEGTHLKALLERGPLSTAQAFDVALQAVEGLQAIHKVGIVHRDLKSLNIMVDPNGVVRVMDFGIAKRVAPEGVADPRASGYVMGTPEYMSPEQARGRKVDFRSDVYALGIVIYEIFTGRVPFRGDTPVATLLMHLERTPPLEGPEAASIPAPVVPVLAKALAKQPDARYATAAELAEALRAAREAALGERTAARVSVTRVLPRPRRVPLPLLLGASALLAAAAAALALRARPLVAPPAAPVSLEATPSATPPAVATPAAVVPASAAPAQRSSPPPASRPQSPPAESAEVPPVAPATLPAPVVSNAPREAATPMPTPDAPSLPTPSPPPAASAQRGGLQIVVDPWAEVSVDGHALGQTPMSRIPLDPGRHDVLLTHPRYEPFQRRVTIRSGETLRLFVNLETDAVPRRR